MSMVATKHFWYSQGDVALSYQDIFSVEVCLFKIVVVQEYLLISSYDIMGIVRVKFVFHALSISFESNSLKLSCSYS